MEAKTPTPRHELMLYDQTPSPLSSASERAIEALAPEDFSRLATTEECLAAIAMVDVCYVFREKKRSLEDRISLANTLAERLTAAQLLEATWILKADPVIDSKARFGGWLTAADWVRVLAVGRSRLYDFSEMLGLCDTPGTTTADFVAVPMGEGKKPKWRRSG